MLKSNCENSSYTPCKKICGLTAKIYPDLGDGGDERTMRRQPIAKISKIREVDCGHETMNVIKDDAIVDETEGRIDPGNGLEKPGFLRPPPRCRE
jgi:hypothetical protein